MIFNKKQLAAVSLALLLLLSFRSAQAFSLREFFGNIFGGQKIEQTQPAASVKAVTTDSTTQDSVSSPGTKTDTTATTTNTTDTTVATPPIKASTPTPLPPKIVLSPAATGDNTIKETSVVLRFGMSNSTNVQRSQKRLITLGYLKGSADGSYGKATALAVASFQKDNNIDGNNGMIIGPVTIKALGIVLLSPDKPIKTTGSVDLKINGSDNPGAVLYQSMVTASWTSTGVSNCYTFGNYMPLWNMSGLWTNSTVGPQGSENLMAALALNGDLNNLQYFSVLTIGIQCDGALTDTVSLPVFLPPTVTITSPNGGETYHQGQQMTMTWNSSGYSANSLVNIDLATHDANGNYTNTFLISVNGSANDGTETFTIPANVPNASNYAMRIEAYEPGGINPAVDHSDTDFTITNQTTSCSSYQYITQWGTQGSGNGQFDHPFGVLADSAGNIYVADTYNFRIQKFTSNGNYITQWGTQGSGNGQFGLPVKIAVDNSSGNIYVADDTNNRIQKFTSNGMYLTEWGGLGQIQGVAVDSLTNVYGVDYINNKIKKFTSIGTPITEWGTQGTGNGQFNWVTGIATDYSNNLYVVDALNYRIQKFTSNGNYITQWGGFPQPIDVATDSLGDVYVLDSGSSSKIKKFTPNGTLITEWGTPGSGDGQLSGAEGLTIDLLGNVYVADTFNHRIQKFGCASATTPTFIESLSSTTPPAQNVTAGTTNVKLVEYDVKATVPTVVNEITMYSQQQPSSYPLAIKNLKLYINGIQVGSTITTLAGLDDFLNLNISFSINETKKLSVYADIDTAAQVGTKVREIFNSVGFSSPLPGPSVITIPPMEGNFFTIVNSTPSSTCAINSFTVPASTTLASGVSVTTSWSSNCNNVVLEANSGSYTLRYAGGATGTHTFSAPVGSVLSNKDSGIDITLIAGNSDDTVSQTKTVPIVDVVNPASNQCKFTSLAVNPGSIPAGSQTTLSWATPVGCIVYVESWTPSAGGLSTAHIFNPGTYYFPATGSVNVTLNKSSTFYLAAQAGVATTTVLSAQTIDAKVQ